ncbi:MAG TPA: hypothetical protein VFA02_14480 [Pseudacidobacterium sp.]|nr:hypothetical protein [Pseudacidobacterium sp.]
MAIGAEAAVEAVEIEAFATEIPSLIPLSKTLYSLAQERFQKVPVAFQTQGGATTRPSFRVPFRVQGGAAIAQGTGDGDSLGRGNASVWQDFVLAPVWHYAVNEITHLAQLATNGKKRGLISLKAEELKNSLDSAMAGIEGIMYGDGSGAITQIPTTATVSSGSGTGNQTSFITGVRAMAFTDNQVVQIFPSEGGVARGTATISINDPVTSTLWFSTALPAGTTTGDYIMVKGSSGAVGSGVIGTTGWINSATSGTVAGINRATYPSRISSPSINLNGGAITASLSQRIEALLGRAMGDSNKTKDSGIYIFGEDQALAVAQTNYYNRQITQNSDPDKNKVPDTSRKYFQGTFGGRDVHISYVQPLGRVDMLLTDDWYIGELVPLQLYDYGGGNTVMPVPDPAGNGWLTSNQFAYEISFNLACSAPRHQLYVYNAAVPTI